MSPILCVLNLSNASTGRGLSPVVDLPFDYLTMQTTHPELIPTDDAPTIVYVVGHAILDGIRMTQGKKPGEDVTLSEEAFAATVQARRQDNKTLMIWDICHAKSFLKIANRHWPDNYGHIFACQAHERTWHTGPSTTPPRQTHFSMELRDALKALQGKVAWPALEDRLQKQLGRLQTPEIVARELTPAQFGL
jgi:hypothetical protein